jgi:hypothetical protein
VNTGDRGGRAPTGVGEDNCEAPLPAGQGDEVNARADVTTLRTAGRQGVRRAMAEAEPRRPGQVGEEVARVPGADGGGPASWRGARVLVGRWKAENPVGQRTGGAAEGGC